MDYSQEHFVRVRYRDSAGRIGGWSAPVRFVTAESPKVAPPAILDPLDGSMELRADLTIQASDFYTINATDTHASTDWQIATDAAFTTIVNSSMADGINLTSWTPVGLPWDAVYYVRVRYRGGALPVSGWSPAVQFDCMIEPHIVTPAILEPNDMSMDMPVSFGVESTTFQVVNSGDTHVATEWRLLDDALNVLSTFTDNDAYKTLYSLTNLDYSRTYFLQVRHQGSILGWSSWSEEIQFTTKIRPVVATPSITTPVSGSTGLLRTVNLTASAFTVTTDTDTHASSDWQLATDAAFTNVVASSMGSATNKTTWTVNNLTYALKYYARVRYNGAAALPTAWSATINFTVELQPTINAPTLTSPSNGATNMALSLNLTTTAFSKVNSSDTHASTDWQVSTNAGFTALVVNVNSLTELTTRTVSGLNYNTTYYVRARHYGSTLGASNWSSVVSFTTQLRPVVATPSITTPVSGSTGLLRTVNLTASAFNVTTGSDTHASSDWQLATDAAFTNIVAQVAGSTTNKNTWTVNNLTYAQQYYARVRYNGAVALPTAWSTVINFTVELQPKINAPTITAPTNGATNTALALNITTSAFSKVNSSDTHASTEWQVATDAGFTSLVVNANSVVDLVSRAVSGMAYNTTYYVRARHYGSTLGASAWSATISFTTQLRPVVQTPSITTPVSGSTGLLRTVNFTASAFTVTTSSDTHASSDWQLATDAAFTNIVASVAASATHKTTWTVNNLTYAQQYYARVRYNGAAALPTAWSPTINFTVELEPKINAPTLTSPTNGATNTALSVNLITSAFSKVNSSDTHASTDWQVATDAGFTNFVLNVNSVTDLTSRTINGLNYNTTYYVRSRHYGSTLGASAWSTTVSFTTQIQPVITAPTLTAPTNGATGVDTASIALSATAFALTQGNDSHATTTWQIATDAGFTTLVLNTTVGSPNLTSYAWASALFQTTYYVRVKYNGASTSSAWSATVSFTTELTPAIVAPTITAPTHNATGLNRSFTATSSAFSKVNTSDTHTRTQWQVSTVSNFATTVIDTTSASSLTSFSVAGLNYATTYYIRARHEGSILGWSAWGTANTITTKAQPIVATPSITSPTNGATNIDYNATMTSSAFAMSVGSDTHASTQWQISTVSNFATTVVDTTESGSNKTSLPLNLAYNTTYYARCRYTGNEAPVSSWSTTVSFTTELQPAIVAPTVTSPTHNSTGVNRSFTATTSAFSKVNTSDTHTQTQWQVSTVSNFATTVIDITSASSLVSLEVADLNYATTYYIRARHEGSVLGWSEWGAVNTFTTKAQPIIATPNVTAPTNGATGVDTAFITLTTSAFSLTQGNDTHQSTTFEVATDAAFTTLAFSKMIKPGSADLLNTTFTTAQYYTTYYVRAKHIGTEATSAWSSTISFTTELTPSIVPPSITSPTNNATGVNKSFTATCSAFSKVNTTDTHTRTHWQVATDAGFTTFAVDVADTNLTSLAISNLQYSTVYYIRARHEGSVLGWSEWGAANTFTTKAQPVVAAPSITSPTNGATNVDYNATMTASAFTMSVGTDTHASTTWQISTNSGFTALVVNTTETGAYKTSLPLNLAYNTTYYARVRYTGTEAPASNWSTTVVFTTEQQPAIVTPSITSPANGATNQQQSLTLTSSAYSTVNSAETHYSSDWQLSTVNTFATLVTSVTGSTTSKTSWAVSGLAYGTTYYARVRYRGSGALLSNWSATISFTVRPQPIVATPTLTAPTNGATGVSINPTLTSSAFAMSQGTDTHQSTDWQVATDAGFTNLVVNRVDDTVNKTSYAVP